MKIAIVSSSYHPYYKGGGEHSVKALAEGLAAKGEEVVVITAYHQEQTEHIDGIKVCRVKHPNIYWSYESAQQPAYKKLLWHLVEACNPMVARRVKALLLREQPDVLHIRNTEDFSPYIAKLARSLNIPVVVTLNSCTWLCPRGTMFKNGHNCTRQCISCRTITYPKKWLSRYVNAVVGVSRFMLDRHTHYHYFPNAAQRTIYTSKEANPHTFPRAHHAALRFGYIGRLHPIKGVAEIIQAFRQMAPLNARLFIAGEGLPEYYHHCQQLAEGNSAIVFLGQSSPEEFYDKVDVVIINSLVNEAFPRVLVEAYAYGRPVIAANTGGTPEMIVPDQTGWIHDPFRAGQLEAAIEKAAAIPLSRLQQMQRNITTFVREHFQNDIDQYITLYRELAP